MSAFYLYRFGDEDAHDLLVVVVKRNGHLSTHGRLLTRPATSDSCRQDTEAALAFSMQNLLDLVLQGHAASSKTDS